MRPVRHLITSLLILTLTAACGTDKDKSPAPEPAAVKVMTIKAETDTAKIRVSGVITPQDNPSRVSFLVSGRVLRSLVREGDEVKAGQLIAEIDPEDYRQNLAKAKAQADMAKAAYDKAVLPVRSEQLEQAKIAYDRASDEYRRMKMLYDSKSLAPNDFEKYKAAYESAAQQYQMAKTGAQPQDKAQAKAAYEQALAYLALARKSLNDTELKAPVNGFISKRLCEPGDTVAQGYPVFEIVGLDPVEVNAGIPETDIAKAKVGQKALVNITALNKSFEGTVRVINVSADPVTRTYMARITVPNPDHLIRIGMVAEAVMDTDAQATVISVPLNAVIKDAQGATVVYVYYPDKQKVYARRIDAGAVTGTSAVIESGLKSGEIIVTAGQERLADGMTVRPE